MRGNEAALPMSETVSLPSSLHPAAQAFAATFGLAHPLIQAPMAGSQGHALAAAVCEAGALGSVPAAMHTAASLREELTALRRRTKRPFNLNFFCHTPPVPDAAALQRWHAALTPHYRAAGLDPAAMPEGAGRTPFGPEMAEVVESFRPAVVSFHFGLPAPELLVRVKATGAAVWSSATTVEEGLWLQAHGADAVIAQGLEAGGHRGHFLSADLTQQLGLFALLPQLVASLRVPVIAAGGIADAAGVQAALALGASAVQVGTAFLLCEEATTSAVHRAALVAASVSDVAAHPDAAHTALTNLFSGRPARGLMNRLMRELGPISDAAPPFPLATAAIGPLRAAAEAKGSGDCSPLWCGQNPLGCRAVPAAAVVRALFSSAEPAAGPSTGSAA